MCGKLRERPTDQDIVFAEVFDHLLRRMESIQHYKIGVRIDRFDGPRHCLIEKSLAIVCIALNEIVGSIDSIQRGRGVSCYTVSQRYFSMRGTVSIFPLLKLR